MTEIDTEEWYYALSSKVYGEYGIITFNVKELFEFIYIFGLFLFTFYYIKLWRLIQDNIILFGVFLCQ